MCNTIIPSTIASRIGGSSLFPPQREILARGYLESSRNWIVCASTGSGKTLIAEWAMLKAINSGKRAAYVAPLKAILQEKLTEWRAKYPHAHSGLFTGDSVKPGVRPKDENLVLFTFEKLSAYLCNWKNNLSWIAELDVVVVDEFHVLGEKSRGPTLEAMLGRIRRINPFARIIGLSGTLSNGEEIAKWLGAEFFRSDWRPVPLVQRVIRFKKAEQKLELLTGEVLSTRSEGGKCLVFVNSRRRSQEIATRLLEHGITAQHNHAGLSRDLQIETQDAFRKGHLDVVVSTSTLEMGVNFPARKVILYDFYSFDGELFLPLSIQRYLQCIGRAGRPGLDSTGESVLLLPVWDRAGVDYLSSEPEPVRSGLFGADALAKELVNEVASRLSISEAHLATNFGDLTLCRTQGGSLDTESPLKHLLDSGMIKKSGDKYLTATVFGRLATQLGICPRSVQLIKRSYEDGILPTEFDLLLVCSLAKETTPKLGFNFEEVDHMADLLMEVPSRILDAPFHSLRERWGFGFSPKAVLSGVKCATILFQHTGGISIEGLAETFDCYPADLILLKRNAGWIIEAAKRIFSILDKREKEETDTEKVTSVYVELCRDLQNMLEYGVPRTSLELVQIRGIGQRRAHTLINAGICTLRQLLDQSTSRLSELLRLNQDTIGRIISSAEEVLDKMVFSEGFRREDPPTDKVETKAGKHPSWNSDIDPYRLRRALELNVDHASAESIQISGGAEPHKVRVTLLPQGKMSYHCDCMDFAKGQVNCKHVLRSRLELRDDEELLQLLGRLKREKDRPLRYSLGELWMKVGQEYDSYFGRSVDYTGQKFLDRVRAKARWKR